MAISLNCDLLNPSILGVKYQRWALCGISSVLVTIPKYEAIEVIEGGESAAGRSLAWRIHKWSWSWRCFSWKGDPRLLPWGNMMSLWVEKDDYTLVNVCITMENHLFSWVNQLFLWPCSLANCQITRG